MTENQERLYLLIPLQGLVVLNKFGHFIQQIPLVAITDFCFDNQELLYLKNNTWFKYKPMMTSDSIIFQIKDTSENRSRILDNKIYIFSEDQISIIPLKH